MTIIDGIAEDENLEPGAEGEGDELTEEEIARAAGWRPFGEWRGPPEEWKPPHEYLEVAEREFPVAREAARRLSQNNARLLRKVDSMEQRMAAMQEATLNTIRDMGAQLRTADARARETARRELLAQRDGAVEAGDTVTFRQIEAQIAELDTAAEPPPPPAPPPPPPGPPPAERAVLEAWVAENPWYSADPVLRALMIQHHSAVRAQNPTMALTRQLSLARSRVVAEMPARFDPEDVDDMDEPPPPAPAPRRPVPPAVSRPTGGNRPTGTQRRTVWDQIEDATERAAVQTQFERFKTLNDDPDMPASEYVTLYLDPHADALALRRARPKKT